MSDLGVQKVRVHVGPLLTAPDSERKFHSLVGMSSMQRSSTASVTPAPTRRPFLLLIFRRSQLKLKRSPLIFSSRSNSGSCGLPRLLRVLVMLSLGWMIAARLVLGRSSTRFLEVVSVAGAIRFVRISG